MTFMLYLSANVKNMVFSFTLFVPFRPKNIIKSLSPNLYLDIFICYFSIFCILLLENYIEAYKKLLTGINTLNICLHLKGHSP